MVCAQQLAVKWNFDRCTSGLIIYFKQLTFSLRTYEGSQTTIEPWEIRLKSMSPKERGEGRRSENKLHLRHILYERPMGRLAKNLTPTQVRSVKLFQRSNKINKVVPKSRTNNHTLLFQLSKYISMFWPFQLLSSNYQLSTNNCWIQPPHCTLHKSTSEAIKTNNYQVPTTISPLSTINLRLQTIKKYRLAITNYEERLFITNCCKHFSLIIIIWPLP